MASEIRVDKINSLSGVGTVSLSPTGVDISGITTAATLKATTGIVTTLTATTGIVTTLTTNTAKVGAAVTITESGIFATGVCTATSFVGNGANLTGITQTTINNNANNRLITGSGTANTLEAESLLTYSPNTQLEIKGTGESGPHLYRDSGNAPDIRFFTSNGTIASPSASVATNSAGNINFGGYDGSAYHTRASINGQVDGSVVDGSDTIPIAIRFRTGTTTPVERLRIGSDGHTVPGADNSYDLGSTSKRWRNVYTTDLKLSNEGSKNEVDGTWGNYTIQEGESDLFLINNRNGKKYKFMLQEVS